MQQIALKQELAEKVSTITIEESQEQINGLPAGEYYFYNGKVIPKQFGWYLALIFLMEKGFKLKCHYRFGLRQEVRDGPELFDYDPELKGFAPITPVKIEIFYDVKIEKHDAMSKYIGPKIETKEIPVVEIVDAQRLADPNPFETLELVELYLNLKLKQLKGD